MGKNKIPATVAILTLNSEKTLYRCLRSVKDFAEIIVCDGNSIDKTISIARQFDARIVFQFKSEVKNIGIKDKAEARNVALDASIYDWHFWLDSDDALSSKLVREVGRIAKLKNPSQFVYQVPLRQIVDGKIVKYSTNLPWYQVRFFHRKTRARFVKPIHEQVSFNQNKYHTGRLTGSYDVYIDKNRLENFLANEISYARKDVESIRSNLNFRWYLRWIIGFQLTTLLGLLIRIPLQYLRFGTKETMPLKIELSRVVGKSYVVLKSTLFLIRKLSKL